MDKPDQQSSINRRLIVISQLDQSDTFEVFSDYWSKNADVKRAPHHSINRNAIVMIFNLLQALAYLFLIPLIPNLKEMRWLFLSLSGLLIFISGMSCQALVECIKAKKVHLRLSDEIWDQLKQVGTSVKICECDEGLRFIRGDRATTMPWVDMKAVRVIDKLKLWYVVDGNGTIGWVNRRDFPDNKSFEIFADWAYDRWKSARPTGKGFEVLSIGNTKMESSQF